MVLAVMYTYTYVLSALITYCNCYLCLRARIGEGDQ